MHFFDKSRIVAVECRNEKYLLEMKMQHYSEKKTAFKYARNNVETP